MMSPQPMQAVRQPMQMQMQRPGRCATHDADAAATDADADAATDADADAATDANADDAAAGRRSRPFRCPRNSKARARCSGPS
jgi:hypothetical protein